MDSTPSSRLTIRLRHAAWTLAGLVIFVAALWTLHRETAGIRFGDVVFHVRSMPWGAVITAAGCAAASYAALTGYDWLALRHVRRSLPFASVALTSFVATAVGHNLGVAMLSGGAVRYRLYSAAGLAATEIATVIGLVGLTFGLGVCFVLGVIMLCGMPETTAILHLPEALVRATGALLLALIVVYGIWGMVRRQPLRLGSWQLELPGPGTTALQVVLAALDISFAAAVLHALLPAEVAVSYPHLLSIYVLAIGAGIISHVPGGLGVFESVLLLALPQAPRDALLGGVLAYRVVYYLFPLALAVLLGIALEARLRRAPIDRALHLVNVLLRRSAPQLLTVLVFVAGALLLFSGATPALAGRLRFLGAFMPLPLLEVSHMAGSLTGLALMLLAYGLQRRVNAAYHVTAWLLALGCVFSLAKGLDYEEALVSLLALVALYTGRAAFFRQASLSSLRLSPNWIALVTMAVVGSLWLGAFAHRHVAYAEDLWWQFALMDDAPRFLRASLLLIVAATSYAVVRLLQPRPPGPQLPDPPALQRAAAIVARSPHCDATLTLVGDKRLMFSASGAGFVMYQVQRGSWIALGTRSGRTRNARHWPGSSASSATVTAGERSSIRSTPRTCRCTSTWGWCCSSSARRRWSRWRVFPCRAASMRPCARPTVAHSATVRASS